MLAADGIDLAVERASAHVVAGIGHGCQIGPGSVHLAQVEDPMISEVLGDYPARDAHAAAEIMQLAIEAHEDAAPSIGRQRWSCAPGIVSNVVLPDALRAASGMVTLEPAREINDCSVGGL